MTYLIIDIGSSSVRTLLFYDDASLIDDAIVSQSHNFTTDTDGKAITDARHIQELVEACVDSILEHPAAQSIRGVGMATFVGNWLGVDRNNQAIAD